MELIPGHVVMIWSILAVILFKVLVVTGSCSFPAALRGQWTRNHDNKVFTFTETGVSGFDFSYFADTITDFDCLSKTGDQYVLSSDFITTSARNYRYLVCWEIVEVTTSAYILYELTSDLVDPNINPAAPGITLEQTNSATSAADICTIAQSSAFPTMLIKDAATSSDVQVDCPESLFATFQYSQCAGSSMNFCPNRNSVTMDYTSCPAILNSNGGVLSCMGHFDRSPYIYVNLFRHDAGNGVTCMRIESGSGGAVTAVYYTGDCTTTSGSSQLLDLTTTATCPIGGDTTTTTASTSTSTATTTTSETASSSTTSETTSSTTEAPISTTATQEIESSGGAASATVIGGSVVAVAAVAAIGIFGAIVIAKKNNGSIVKVRDTDDYMVKPDTEKPLSAITTVTTTTSTPPATTNGDFRFPDLNHSPRRLPPLTNVEASGEPLRA